MYLEVYNTFETSKGHDDDSIPEYNVHFITEVPSPVDTDLVISAVAQDLTMNILKKSSTMVGHLTESNAYMIYGNIGLPEVI